VFSKYWKIFENLEYVKAPNEGIIGSTSGMFSMMGGIAKLTHLMHVVHDQKMGPK
jgi:hypothetical protein